VDPHLNERCTQRQTNYVLTIVILMSVFLVSMALSFCIYKIRERNHKANLVKLRKERQELHELNQLNQVYEQSEAEDQEDSLEAFNKNKEKMKLCRRMTNEMFGLEEDGQDLESSGQIPYVKKIERLPVYEDVKFRGIQVQ
jgi:mannitol-specific phosphotransferase system IIBC component